MKLKNSYILLIALIFLLVSIGSVCASDDVSNDNDDILASDNTDISLAEDDTQDTLKDEINTTIETEKDTYKFSSSDSVSFKMDVKDEYSNPIDYTGKIFTFIGNESNENLIENTEEDGNITLWHPFEIGNYSILINFIGDETHKASSKKINLTITNPDELIMPSLVICNSDSITIPLIINDGLENRSYQMEDLKVNFTYTDSEGNIKYIETFQGNTGYIEIINIPAFTKANVTVTLIKTGSTKKASVKYNTTINSSSVVIVSQSASRSVNVTVLMGNGSLVNGVNGNNLKIYEGTSLISPSNYVNGILTFSNTIGVGRHNLTIVYSGDDTYASSNKTIMFGVTGNVTFTVDNVTKIDANNIANLQTHLTNGVELVNINKDNLTITLNYTDENNENHSVNIVDFNIDQVTQIINFTVSEKFTKAQILVKYISDDVKSNATSLIRIESIITADDVIEKGTDNVLNFTASVKSSNGTDLNITKDNFKVYNGKTLLNTTYTNGVVVINDKLAYGTYNLVANYTGNSVFSDASKKITLKVVGFANNATSISVNSTKEVTIKLNVTDKNTTYDVSASDLNITGFYKNGNDTVNLTFSNIKVENNTLTFTVDDLNFTTANLTIKYKDLAVYKTTLNKVFAVVAEVINNEGEYQSGNFTYRIIDRDTGEVVKNQTIKLTYSIQSGGITFQQSIDEKTDENGIVVFNNSKIYVAYFNMLFGLGNHTITLGGSGLTFENATQPIHISQATIAITIDPYSQYYGSEEKVKIHVYNSKTHDPMKYVTLHMYMPDSSQKDYYFQTNENGTSEISVTGLVGGTYKITVNNNDTQNMTSASADGSIEINRIPVVINAKDSTMYYNSGTTSTIKVTRNGAGVNGVYVLVRLYTTSSKYSDYLFQTNSKGEIAFSAPLNVGKHKMIVSLADNRYDASSVTKTITVKKATAKISAPKVTAYYKQGKYFTAKLTNTKNKKVIYGAKLKITISTKKLRYKPITGTTGSDGKLKLNINLNPGTYNVVVQGADSKNFKVSKVSSKIVVKKAPTKLSPSKLTAKKGAKKYFKVKVTNKKTKKIISGVKIKIKVKSKTYTVKSDSKGIAKLATKSFKAGTYKVTVTSANTYCVAKTAKSTIKIKK